MPLPIIPGLGAVADRYDGFIVDLWGVVHDGASPYPSAEQTLSRLKQAGKRTVLLSNAPRRGYALIEGMQAMGLGRGLYDEVMSSGEAVHIELQTRKDPWYARLGRRCYHLGPERDRSIFDGLDLECVPLEDAEFIVNTGPWGFDLTVGDFEELLQAGARRKLPMVCANPDIVVIREGRKVICAGALAQRYEALGGDVSYRGKPDPAIYDFCLELLGIADRSRVLGIGDAFHTDIAGATGSGLDALFVTGGIHHEELGIAPGDTPSAAALKRLIAHHDGIQPTYAIPCFRW